MPTKVFGFGGVSCGGKTTLADRINAKLPGSCTIIHQDDYYWPEDHPFWKYDGTDNWDDITAFDMARLIEDVQEEITRGTSYIVLEGIMIYEQMKLDELITHKYFFTLPFDVFIARRLLRNYEPPDPFPEYGKVVYWPVYQQQLETANKRNDIVFMNSTEALDSLEKILLNDMLTDSCTGQ